LRVMSVCRYVISDALRKNKNVIDCLWKFFTNLFTGILTVMKSYEKLELIW
jgi:hypothetical protein